MAIEVDSLSVKYQDYFAVNNISFTVAEKEIFGIIGPNGAGKTSAVECVEGLKKPYGGRIRVLGLDPWKDRRQLHSVMGVQLQDTFYPDRARVHEILKLFSSLYSNPAPYDELIELIGLEHRKKAYVSKLSGGERQKLSIILALISNPKVVFLDELTTGLDPKARRQMWDLILHLRGRGLTIVIVSHFMDEVQAICDRVAIMNKGEILCCGSIASVINDFNLKSKIVFSSASDCAADLQRLDCVASAERSGEKILVLGGGNGFLEQVLKHLNDTGVSYSGLTVKEPDLEDVFLSLTGYSLNENDGAIQGVEK